jgi:hypothetical protein
VKEKEKRRDGAVTTSDDQHETKQAGLHITDEDGFRERPNKWGSYRKYFAETAKFNRHPFCLLNHSQSLKSDFDFDFKD